MAIREWMRNRMQGQRPVGAAENMEQGFGTRLPQLGRARVEPQEQEVDLDRLTRTRTTEEDDAYKLGQQMGAEGLMRMAGIEPFRQRELTGQNRLMNEKRLAEASATLLKYMGAKSSVNDRVIKAQQWWKLKNWEQIRRDRNTKAATTHPSNTGWLWNCIVGKHADAIDSYPEPVILPRMEDDEEEAKSLSAIIPVVMEMNEFEKTYNDVSWQKMQEGTGVYGIFWNTQKLNGLGDIDIKKVNILNLYWEPGISDIQDSRNVFYISFEDKDELQKQYPQLEGRLGGSKLSVKKYQTDDNVDLSDKAAVIDWYYKVHDEGRTTLHYCKFVDEICLYSSEEKGLEEGYYADGSYPFVLDALFPVEGSPAGYGYIDIAKDSQTDIDTLSQAMVLNATVRATPRYFIRKDGSINEKEYADLSKPFIHTSGNLGQDSLRPVEVQPMGGDAHNMLQQKIDEIKFITGNTDVNNGGVPSGVTAASAIAALKEDSGRSSKDSTKAAYRSYRLIVNMVIERIRQFYDIPRQFRIMGTEGAEDGMPQFTSYSNAGLQPQQIPNMPGQEPGMRLPVFDIEVRAQRENAYTKMSQNELALQFWGIGAFNPQMTDQTLLLLDMMDFRGKDTLKKKIMQQGTLRDVLMQVAQIALALSQKYDPAVAQQLGMIMQNVSADLGMQIGGGVNMPKLNQAPDNEMAAPHEANESGIVRSARERAANASRPD
jgi:hypothetical protein